MSLKEREPDNAQKRKAPDSPPEKDKGTGSGQKKRKLDLPKTPNFHFHVVEDGRGFICLNGYWFRRRGQNYQCAHRHCSAKILMYNGYSMEFINVDKHFHDVDNIAHFIPGEGFYVPQEDHFDLEPESDLNLSAEQQMIIDDEVESGPEGYFSFAVEDRPLDQHAGGDSGFDVRTELDPEVPEDYEDTMGLDDEEDESED